jgi:hypothetical protein
MLHIHNGDSAADTAKQSSLTGEHFAWRESLITGPTPGGLSGDDWRSLRAQHLSESYGVDLKECEQNLLSQEEALSSFSEHDEVILWFEHDLFCQLHLIYLLNWFSQRAPGKTKLSLICIGEFPGRENFRGLGELTPDELASLFPARQQITQKQFDLAAAAWEAYSSDDPTNLQKLLKTDTSNLPFLSNALKIHLQRFPSTKNGLGRIENTALRLIDAGAIQFNELFPRFAETEALYGFGDAQLWLALRRMNQVPHPLFSVSGNAGEEMDREIVATAVFEITEVGKAVLRAETDFVALNGIENWLGDVHLSERKNLWRWDEESQTLVLDNRDGIDAV